MDTFTGHRAISFTFPIHISEDGERIEPTNIDPYSLPWVQGAAESVPLKTRAKYPAAMTDLREKLAVLKTKRPALLAAEPVSPAYGPRKHGPGYLSLDQRPLPDTKDTDRA